MNMEFVVAVPFLRTSILIDAPVHRTQTVAVTFAIVNPFSTRTFFTSQVTSVPATFADTFGGSPDPPVGLASYSSFPDAVL